jgi:BTB/POZ domain
MKTKDELGVERTGDSGTWKKFVGYFRRIPKSEAQSEAQTTKPGSHRDIVPVRPGDHGSAISTVIVGRDQAQTFTIHKHLLSQASPYFYGALEGNFKEGCEETLKLEEDYPMVFEVLYHWLYSGCILQASFYTQGSIPDDLLWLRVYKFADMRLLEKFQELPFRLLKEMFSADEQKVPSPEFVEELFNSRMPQLQQYIVNHTAFWIFSNNFGRWEAVLSHNQSYGHAVAVQLAKLHSSYFEGCKEHPATDKGFIQHEPRTVTQSAGESSLERKKG